MTYQNILVAVDGSVRSDFASQAALSIAACDPQSTLIACHAYAAKLHFDRFEAMEDGLPDQFQDEENLNHLQKTHDDLIGNGLELISDAYTKELCIFAHSQGIKCKNSCPEGKNFKEVLNIIKQENIQLAVLGSSGQGEIGDNCLGSVAERILMYEPSSDILLMKKHWNLKNRPIIVGIDGSQAAYQALNKALDLTEAYHTSLIAVAVYDPFFHASVFKTIADVLPVEDQEKFNFTAQEKLHDEIIDKGLEKVYRDGLEKAKKIAESRKTDIEIKVLEGKVYAQLMHYAALKNAGLIVMGRHGQHYEAPSLIGSNTHQLARLANNNILIVAESKEAIEIPELEKKVTELTWSNDAGQAISNIPEFVRKRAKWTIEEYAREKGISTVTKDIVNEVQQKIGMGSRSNTVNDQNENHNSNDQPSINKAIKVVFRKTKKMAPNFHRHMVQEQVLGKIVKIDDVISVYTIHATEPTGSVLIDEQTIIEFL